MPKKKSQPLVDATGDQHKAYGKVPKYLKKFNEEKKEKTRQSEIDKENAKCPPGTRKMEDGERKDMLSNLQESKIQIEKDLDKLPISMKTLAI